MPRIFWGALLLAPLLVLALLSREWSLLPEVTTRRAVALFFTSLFGLYLAARWEWRELMGLLAGVFTFLAIGSYIAVLVAPGWAVHQGLHDGAWKGLWYEKNGLGQIMVWGALACGCAAVLQPARRLLWLGGAFLCAGLVVASTSATSLLGLMLVAAGLVVLAGFRRGGALMVLTAWLVVVGLGAVVGVLAFAPGLVLEALGKDATLTGRTDIWSAVLRQVAERPVLGHGFGAFWADKGGPVGWVRNEVDWAAPTAHNGWLEILIGLGWTGAILFTVHMLVTALAALFSIGRGPHAYWAVLSLAIFLLFSLSESTILQQNSLIWALYVMTAAKLLQLRGVKPPR
jgi:O-antigen ligase